LGAVLDRLQHATQSGSATWYPGRFRKRFVCDDLAPGLARAAIATTAIGIPANAFHDGVLLTSELVTNSVKHSGSPWVEVGVVLEADELRVEVSDQNGDAVRPRTPDIHGGWGLTLVAELATRWGVERERGRKTIWTEIALTR